MWMLMSEWLQPGQKPSAAAMMILIYMGFLVFQLCVKCGELYGVNTMSIFTTIWNIDIWNWLTLWYLELKFELNFHGYIESEGIDYWPVDGANSASWYWMVNFGFDCVRVHLCVSSCVVWHVSSFVPTKSLNPTRLQSSATFSVSWPFLHGNRNTNSTIWLLIIGTLFWRFKTSIW